MKLVRCAFLVAALFAGSQASATVIDLSTTKCQEFLQTNKDEVGIILAWINGYYRDEDDPPVIDTDKFVADSKELAVYCAANPTLGLITAADKVFGK